MQLAMICLGRMGVNMTRHLASTSHQLVVYDNNPDTGGNLACCYPKNWIWT